MKVTKYRINESGLNEIRAFIEKNHKLGDDHSIRKMLMAFAEDAEESKNAGREADIELTRWDSDHGYTMTYTVSDDGFDVVEEDIEG